MADVEKDAEGQFAKRKPIEKRPAFIVPSRR